jgi:PTS system mannose-specific IIA component
VAALDHGEGVLVLTDMYGDTPSNAALSCARPGRVAVVTGVNLPMVVRLGCREDSGDSVEELARWLEIKGRRSICRAGEDRPPEEGG